MMKAWNTESEIHGAQESLLIMEGGAMRGLFTAGVLDFFMDQKLFCERVIGVSAGALCGYNYVAGEDGRTCYLNTKYCDDWRYLSMKSFVRTGNACGREFAFDEIPNRLEPFDYAGFDQSPMQLIAVSSDLVTGEADYLLVVTVASMADYEALTRRLFEGDDNIKRFRTSVALASLKTGLRVPLDSAAPAA